MLAKDNNSLMKFIFKNNFVNIQLCCSKTMN